MRTIVLIIGIAVMFTSCQKTMLGSITANTPQDNFEEMWKGYDELYGMFNIKNINWDSLRTALQPQVNATMSNQQLYDLLCELIKPLNDIHVFLQPTSDNLPRYESSEFYRTHTVQSDFSIDLIKQNYLPSLITIDDNFHYGILPGNIGYIHFGAFDMPVNFYEMQMDKVMNSLRDTKAIIVDICNNGGGSDKVSRYLAGRFVQERKLFMTTQKKNGPAHDDFTIPEYWYADKQSSFQYTKPVELLTTRWTASAGETFTWAMNTQAHITQIGDTTSGGFSDVIARELPNGWLYFVSVGDFRNAEGKSEEGTGIVPAIISTNTKEDIDTGKDKVLELAIAKLN